MAIGDAVTTMTSVAAGASLTVRPTAGVEWIIHNIQWGAATAELYKTDGTNSILMYSDPSGPGSLLGVFLHLTNSVYLTVKNTSASTAVLSYDGVISK